MFGTSAAESASQAGRYFGVVAGVLVPSSSCSSCCALGER